jgi:uncharacterized membrane protein YcaP (DUF421 family)
MDGLWNWLAQLLGLYLEPKDLTFFQISLRGVIVLVFTLVLVRFGDRRSLSKKSAFDAALLIILASVLARAVNGSASFFPTLGGGTVLVLLHRLLAFLSERSTSFRHLIKGEARVVVRDGSYQRAVMVRTHLHPEDIREDMRLNAATDTLEEIEIARVESNGDISFIKKG